MVSSVAIPLLALHAKDDPIVHDLAAPYEEIKLNKYSKSRVIYMAD
jgi:predicted alpha/beta-fold hydrolase